MERQRVIFQDLGNMEYQAAWDYQEQLLAEKVAAKSAARVTGKEISDDDTARHHLLFVEHPPVYTLGKNGNIQHVLISEEDRVKNNVGFYKINRGGDITFHGPGQLVAYPIFDLERFYTDIGRFMRDLEEVVIKTLAEYEIKGERSAGETGVWIEPGRRGRERKICAIGIRCSRWITMHGFAFNVNTDLDYFNNIIPCGIRDKQVTSLGKELSTKPDMHEVGSRLKRNFEEVFGIQLTEEKIQAGARRESSAT